MCVCVCGCVGGAEDSEVTVRISYLVSGEAREGRGREDRGSGIFNEVGGVSYRALEGGRLKEGGGGNLEEQAGTTINRDESGMSRMVRVGEGPDVVGRLVGSGVVRMAG